MIDVTEQEIRDSAKGVRPETVEAIVRLWKAGKIVAHSRKDEGQIVWVTPEGAPRPTNA
jgi:hypothetical protein